MQRTSTGGMFRRAVRAMTVNPGDAGERRGAVKVWLIAFFGFFMAVNAWSFASPYDGFPDEIRHVARAYTVAEGQIVYDGPLKQGVAWLRVPESLAPSPPYKVEGYTSCFIWNSAKNASCAKPPGQERQKHRYVLLPSGSASYNPVYYLAVGMPLRIWPDYRGIYLSRAISAAYNCALLATAVAICAFSRRRKVILAGLLIAVTPVVLDLSAAINPAGIEIAGAIALWTAGAVMVAERRWSAGLLATASIGAAILVTVRAGGPAWLAVVAAALAVGIPVRQWWRIGKRLLRDRRVRLWAAFLMVASVAAVGWDLWQGPEAGNFGTQQAAHGTYLQNLVGAFQDDLWDRGDFLVNGMVGVVGFSDTWAPGVLWSVWYLAFGVVIFGAMAFGRWRDRVRILSIVAVAAVLTVASDIVPRSLGNTFSQGRYVLPATVGVPILAALVVVRAGLLDAARTRQLIRSYVVVLIPLQMFMVYETMLRFQEGLDNPKPINPFKGQWTPPVGPYLPFFLGLAGLSLCGVLFWRLADGPVGLPDEAGVIPAMRPGASPDPEDSGPADPPERADSASRPSELRENLTHRSR